MGISKPHYNPKVNYNYPYLFWNGFQMNFLLYRHNFHPYHKNYKKGLQIEADISSSQNMNLEHFIKKRQLNKNA